MNVPIDHESARPCASLRGKEVLKQIRAGITRHNIALVDASRLTHGSNRVQNVNDSRDKFFES